MAADAHDVSLYGLEFLLPAGFDDLTDYAFEAQDAPLQQLAFAEESIPRARLHGWLEHVRGQVATLSGASALPIRPFRCPAWPAEGFEARFGHGDSARYLGCVAVSHPPKPITVRAKGAKGYAQVLESVIESLKPATPGEHRIGRYRVLGLSFECPVKLRNPEQFAFASEDGASRLTCLWSATKAEWGDSDWTARCTVPADAVITLRDRVEEILPARDVSAAQFEVVRTRAAAVVAADGSGAAPVVVELFHGEARCSQHGRHLYLEFTSQAGAASARTLFDGLLRSMRREA